jgi:hypothetical protein
MKSRLQRPIAHIGLCTLMIAGTALAGSASAQQSRWNGDAITVYVNPNFGGPSMTLRGDTPDLVQLGLNDKISSIQIPDGETWEVCQDVNYEAQCQVLSGSVPDLRSMGWNDRISSLRRINNNNNNNNNGGFGNRRSTGVFGRRDTGVGVTVFTNPNFGGQSATLRNDTPNLVPLGLNDLVSSIEIPNGEAWEVCQDVDYGNQCRVFTSSVPDLRSMGWNDRISSLRRVNGAFGNDRYGPPVGTAGVQQGLVFYNRTNYKGASRVVTAGTSNMGFSGQTRSVRLRGGGPWQVCDDAGQCATINQDVNDLFALGLNGRIASVRPVNDRFRGGRIR